MQYKVSVAISMDRIANQNKVPKWLRFKNVHILGAYVHIHM